MPRGRTLETKARDSWMLGLRRSGMSLGDIAKAYARQQNEVAAETGSPPVKVLTDAAIHFALKKARDESYRENHGDAIELEVDRLDELIRQAYRILLATHYKSSTSGKLVIGPDGTPLRDPEPVLAAIRELRMLGESRRKLLGLDAPTRQRVEIISEDMIDQEIMRLEAKIGAAAETAGRGQLRAIEAAPLAGPAQT
jgi:hypothetical protein